MQFQIDKQNDGNRLDKFLVAELGQARNQIQKLIKNGSILVNQKKVAPHKFLKTGDTIEITANVVAIGETEKTSGQPKQIFRRAASRLQSALTSPLPKEMRPTILHQTKDFIIIEKPAGLLAHATKASTEPTLVDWLVKKFPKIKKIADSEALIRNDYTFRPGIVHRLDREVSGLMLVALNQSAFEYYKEQFKKRNIKKTYIALVHGQLSEDATSIEFEISRKKNKGQMAAHPKGSGKGRPSITEYKVIKRYSRATLVEINLQTGRTNQIRVHFFALGHPVIGDQVYRVQNSKLKAKSMGAALKLKLKTKQLLLHAAKLSFVDQENHEQNFESKLPAEFSGF